RLPLARRRGLSLRAAGPDRGRIAGDGTGIPRRRSIDSNVSTFAGCFAFRPRSGPAAVFLRLANPSKPSYDGGMLTAGSAFYFQPGRLSQGGAMDRALRAAVLAALVAVVSGVASLGADGTIKFTDITLKNGLRVIVSEDHSAPTFSIAVTYNVGSADEK